MKEEWRDIKGWEGKHQISNYGRIKTFDYRNCKGRIEIRDGYLNNKSRYYIVFVDKLNKRREYHYINRLELITFEIPIPEEFKNIPLEKLEADHIDGNPHNNRIDNLRWVDHPTNMSNPNTKLKISEACKGEKNGFYGKHHTEETKRKLSQKYKKGDC